MSATEWTVGIVRSRTKATELVTEWTVYKMFYAINPKSELLNFVSTLLDVVCTGIYFEDTMLICY
jgi:hypothetical protein